MKFRKKVKNNMRGKNMFDPITLKLNVDPLILIAIK